MLCGLFYEAICYVLPCVILFLCFSVLLALRLPRLGKRELVLVVPVLVLLFVAFVLFYEAIRFKFWLVLFCSCVLLSPLSIVIASLGEERANLRTFRAFVRFALVWFCLFLLPFGVWEGLRLVIVALPGLFSYLFVCF